MLLDTCQCGTFRQIRIGSRLVDGARVCNGCGRKYPVTSKLDSVDHGGKVSSIVETAVVGDGESHASLRVDFGGGRHLLLVQPGTASVRDEDAAGTAVYGVRTHEEWAALVSALSGDEAVVNYERDATGAVSRVLVTSRWPSTRGKGGVGLGVGVVVPIGE